MLEGELRARVGGRGAQIGGRGDTLEVPAGTPHTMWNAGPGRARAVWQTRPALKTEAFFEMVWGLAQGERERRGDARPRQGRRDVQRVRGRVPPRAARPGMSWLRRRRARRAGRAGQGELHVGDPRFDDWEVMGDFDRRR